VSNHYGSRFFCLQGSYKQAHKTQEKDVPKIVRQMTKLSQVKAGFFILKTKPQIAKGASRGSLTTKSAGAKESGALSFGGAHG